MKFSMNKKILILLLAFGILVGGCVQLEESTDTETTTAENTGSSDAGSAEQTGAGTEWCKAGTSWSWSGVSEGVDVNWKIEGLTAYKGKTMCYVTYGATGEGEEMNMEYYFSEDEKEIYMIIKDAAGNVMSEQHITG